MSLGNSDFDALGVQDCRFDETGFDEHTRSFDVLRLQVLKELVILSRIGLGILLLLRFVNSLVHVVKTLLPILVSDHFALCSRLRYLLRVTRIRKIIIVVVDQALL